MADFFKGLAGGFGTGLQLGQAVRDRNMRDELAQAYAKPETSQGYTADQGQQLEALANTGAYDIVPQYGPAAEGQAQGAFTGYQAVPKAGLDLQGDMPAATQAFNPQQVQDYGDRRVAGQFDPTQLRGLQMREAAGVLGRYGDVKGATALQGQADEQDYQAKVRPLQLQGLERQAALGDLQLTEAQRTATQGNANRAAQSILAELSAAGTPIDTATANRIATETGADMKFVTESVLGQYNLTKESANNAIQHQLDDFNKAAEGGIPTLNTYLADRLDPDKTDNIVPKVIQGADGKLRVMYGNNPLPGYQAYGSLDQLSAAFIGNIKRDPLSAAIQISTLNAQAQALLASQASIRASDSTAGLRNMQAQSIQESAGNAKERLALTEQFQALTQEEQDGTKGRNIIKQFNLLNVKAGGQVAVGAAAKPEFTPKDYAATVKSFTDAGFSQTDSLIRADQLYGRGPADSNLDAGLQKQNEAKGAAAKPTPARRGPGDLSTVDIEQIRANAATLDAAIAQAQAQATAVVRSGDVASIRLYGDKLNALKAQREALTSGLTGPAIQTVGLR